MATDLTITAAVQQSWDADEARLLKEIAHHQAELARRQQSIADIRAKRTALALLHPESQAVPVPWSLTPAESGVRQSSIPLTTESFIDAMVRIARAAPKPLAKHELKALLAQSGQQKQEGPQFYTTLKRLKDKGRVRVLPNGDVWGPES